MSTIAIFVFASPDTAQLACERLYSIFSSGGFSKVGNDVHIEISCPEPEIAFRVCRSYGGQSR